MSQAQMRSIVLWTVVGSIAMYLFCKPVYIVFGEVHSFCLTLFFL